MLLLLRGVGGPVVAPQTSRLLLAAGSRVLAMFDDGRALALRGAERILTFLGNEMAGTFPEQFDPTDLQNYTFDLTGVLETAETIATASITIDGGLVIGGAGYATVIAAKTVSFWVSATDPAMPAVDANLVLTVTTSSAPSRRLQRSAIIQVRQR